LPHWIRRVVSRAIIAAGKISDAKMAIIEITTSISTSVKAKAQWSRRFLDARNMAVPPRSKDRSHLPLSEPLPDERRPRMLRSILAPSRGQVELVCLGGSRKRKGRWESGKLQAALSGGKEIGGINGQRLYPIAVRFSHLPSGPHTTAIGRTEMAVLDASASLPAAQFSSVFAAEHQPESSIILYYSNLRAIGWPVRCENDRMRGQCIQHVGAEEVTATSRPVASTIDALPGVVRLSDTYPALLQWRSA